MVPGGHHPGTMLMRDYNRYPHNGTLIVVQYGTWWTTSWDLVDEGLQ